MSSIDVSVFIPVFNESIHIERVVTNALQLTPHVFVIDSYSTDDTVEVAERLGARVFQYEWSSTANFARKLNWALDNIPVETTWVVRLDADEYLVPDTVARLPNLLSSLDAGVNAVSLNRRFYFLGKWIRRGFYPQRTLRITRFGLAKYDDTWLDEHVNVKENEIHVSSLDLVDESLIGIDRLIQKHIHYSNLQVIEEVRSSFELNIKGHYGGLKQQKTAMYNRLPLVLRPMIYFIYRYFLKMGFLDGMAGFVWAFLHSWWYRLLVDIKLLQINAACGSDLEKRKDFIKAQYKVDL